VQFSQKNKYFFYNKNLLVLNKSYFPIKNKNHIFLFGQKLALLEVEARNTRLSMEK
jgi:hypothetical protein